MAVMTFESFLLKAKTKHKNKFNYDKSVWLGYNTPITILCPVHNEITMTPKKHLRSKFGCIQCSYKKRGLNLRSNTGNFVAKMKDIVGDAIDFSKFEYSTNKTHSTCICSVCNHEWLSRPDALLTGNVHCPACRVNAIYTPEYYKKHGIPNHPCYIYLAVFENNTEKFLKVGITKEIKKRFRDSSNYKRTIDTYYLTDFYTAYQKEQELLNQFKSYKYQPKHIFSGHTECLSYTLLEELKCRLVE